MNVLEWLRNFLSQPRNEFFTGVNDDPRCDSEKERDWDHAERLAVAPVNPFDNQQILVSPYPYENQNRTSSCVPHGVGLALAIERKMDVGGYERLSWIFNYRLRANYPAEGCYLQNVFDNYKKIGAPLYTTLPDPQFEWDANSIVLTPQMYTEAEIFKGLSYYTLTAGFNNIETLAGIASKGHAVPILIYGQSDEWGLEYPTVNNAGLSKSEAEIVHCVCILPNSGFVKDGVRYVTIQDSARFGAKSLRHVSESFIKARSYAAGYWDTVVPIGAGPVPRHKFTRALRVGASGGDVEALQKLFISEGLLPSDMATGYFGGRTLSALHAFQSKYASDILTPNGLTAPTDLFGPSSIAKANFLCA